MLTSPHKGPCVGACSVRPRSNPRSWIYILCLQFQSLDLSFSAYQWPILILGLIIIIIIRIFGFKILDFTIINHNKGVGIKYLISVSLKCSK